MVLHPHLPEDMDEDRGLPGIQPVQGPWLSVDSAYGGQMARREVLLATRRADVLACPRGATAAAQEALETVLPLLPGLGFDVAQDEVTCPDGRVVLLEWGDPLGVLGRLVQCDFCLMHRPEGAAEHLLGAAVLCFPASWTLAEKIGKPLLRIHKPVFEYPGDLERRVQRLLDGVQVGRPLWRFNRLRYADPELFQPRSETDKTRRDAPPEEMIYERAERQTLLRLPKSRWVVFAIHTYVALCAKEQAA